MGGEHCIIPTNAGGRSGERQSPDIHGLSAISLLGSSRYQYGSLGFSTLHHDSGLRMTFCIAGETQTGCVRFAFRGTCRQVCARYIAQAKTPTSCSNHHRKDSQWPLRRTQLPGRSTFTVWDNGNRPNLNLNMWDGAHSSTAPRVH